MCGCPSHFKRASKSALLLGFIWLAVGISHSPAQTASPAPAASFLGIDDTGWVPPDTHGAVGPNHVVTAVNGGVRVHDRAGNVLKSVTLNAFFSSSDAFDPKVFYDHFADRWILVAVANRTSPDSAVLVAASQTSDPTRGWIINSIDADASNNLWADYPSVGFNGKWLAVGVNMYGIRDSSFTARLYVVSRAALYAGGTVNPVVFDEQGGTLVPAVTHDVSATTLFVLQSWRADSGGRAVLRLLALNGDINAPQLSVVGFPGSNLAYAYNRGVNGNLLPQAGSSALINAGDDRMQSVVYRNGSLWAAHNGYNGSRAFVQWWQISPQAQTLQHGRVEDTGGTFHYCFPSIAVNRDNDVLLGFSQFSSGTFGSAAYAFRQSGDPVGMMRVPMAYKNGEGVYDKGDGGRTRWGDYSATVTDPLDDTAFWTVQEYAATGNTWATRWARIVPPGGASVIRFGETGYSVGEDAGSAVISVTRSGNLRSAVTVNYATANGTAIAGSDYTSSSGTLAFGDGEQTKSFSVPINNDADVESDETVTLALSSPGAGGTLGSPSSVALTIADNDVPLPVITVTATDNSASEPSDPAVFTVMRSGSTAVPLTVSYALSGSATSGSDYGVLSGALTIPAGSATGTVTLTPIDDAVAEGTEDVTLTLSSGSAYTVGTPGSAVVSLLDNDQPPVVTIQATDASASEPADGGRFTVSRAGATAAALTVNLTIGGSATAGIDYIAIPASITIAAGAASTTIDVTPLDDSLIEAGETVVLTVAAGNGYTVGGASSATVTLADNDIAVGNDAFAGRISFTGSNMNGANATATKEMGEPNHAGNAGGKSVWWSWTATFNGNATFSTEGSGFDTLLAVYTGSSVGALTLVASDDDAGGNLTSRVSFNAVVGTVYQIAVDGFAGASGGIFLSRTGDPSTLPTVSIQSTDSSAYEGSTDTAAFTLTRAGDTSAALAVGLAIGGTAINASDYQAITTTFTIPAGASSATLVVSPLDDAQIEGPETVVVSLQSNLNYAIGSPSSATVTINDNDSTVGNDSFGSAAVMTATTEFGSNVGATKEGGEPNHGGDAGGKSVWWTWTASFSGPVTFRTLGSSFDTLLAVYTGTVVNGLTLIAGDNNGGASNTSAVSFSAVSGTVYRIAVDGASGSSGSIVLTRSGDPAPLPTVSLSAGDATAKEGSVDTGRFLISRTGATTAALTVNVSVSGTAINGTDYQTIATTQTVPAGASSVAVVVTAIDDLLQEGEETVVMQIQPSSAYEVEGEATPYVPGGRAIATVSIIDNETTVSNDAFANGYVLSGTSFSANGGNSTFTKEDGEPSHAGNMGGKSAWWRWTAPEDGTFTITTDGSSFDTVLAVYTGNAVSALSLVASDDDTGPNLTSQTTFTAVAGTVYRIAVDGYASSGRSAASGSLTLTGSRGGAAALPVLSGPSEAEAAMNIPFSYTISATGTPTLYGATGLPAGLTIDSGTGVISGVPSSAGVYAVTLSATNGSGTGTAVLTLTVRGPSAQIYYQTDFSLFPYGVGQLVNNDGWQATSGADGASGIFNGFAGRGQSMYLGYHTFGEANLWLWRPLGEDPLNDGTPLVRFTAEINLVDSNNGQRDRFGFQIYNNDGQHLASLVFDNNTKLIYCNDGSTSSYADIGFDNNVSRFLEVEIDYAGNTWSAWLGGARLFESRPFHQGGYSLSLGNLAVFWSIASPGSSGDNYLIIDDFSIVAGAPGAQTFASNGGLVVPSSGDVSPYPSTVSVNGMGGSLDRLTVRLQGLSHTWAEDLDILLVAPNGQTVVLMSDAGGSGDYFGNTLVFDDLAPSNLPNADPGTHSARYRPTDYSDGTSDHFPSPAPSGPYSNTLGALYGINPNGEWKLYVVDDTGGDGGEIASWSLEIGTASDVSQNYEGWRANFFNVAEISSGLGNRDSDPDRDGIANLLEFAFGLQPRRADVDRTKMPQSTVEVIGGQRYLVYQYSRDLSRSGISYTLQTSTDLIHWSTFSGQDQLLGQVGTVETRKAYLPMVAPRAMIRLRVTSP